MRTIRSLWACAGVVAAALAAGGCEEPDAIINQPPPGGDVRKQLMPKDDVSEALGEGANVGEKPSTLAGLVPAPPTAKDEKKTTPAGVEYTTLKEGTGEPVKVGQRVAVHYVGTLDDGRKFDSSRDRGEPFKVTLGTGAVIKGWDEAVPGMKVGEVRKLWIPASAGYGALGKSPQIPPNAPLVFEIELMKIE